MINGLFKYHVNIPVSALLDPLLTTTDFKVFSMIILLQEMPGTFVGTKDHLSKLTGIPKFGVIRSLKKLQENGYILKVGKEKDVLYYAVAVPITSKEQKEYEQDIEYPKHDEEIDFSEVIKAKPSRLMIKSLERACLRTHARTRTRTHARDNNGLLPNSYLIYYASLSRKCSKIELNTYGRNSILNYFGKKGFQNVMLTGAYEVTPPEETSPIPEVLQGSNFSQGRKLRNNNSRKKKFYEEKNKKKLTGNIKRKKHRKLNLIKKRENLEESEVNRRGKFDDIPLPEDKVQDKGGYDTLPTRKTTQVFLDYLSRPFAVQHKMKEGNKTYDRCTYLIKKLLNGTLFPEVGPLSPKEISQMFDRYERAAFDDSVKPFPGPYKDSLKKKPLQDLLYNPNTKTVSLLTKFCLKEPEPATKVLIEDKELFEYAQLCYKDALGMNGNTRYSCSDMTAFAEISNEILRAKKEQGLKQTPKKICKLLFDEVRNQRENHDRFLSLHILKQPSTFYSLVPTLTRKNLKEEPHIDKEEMNYIKDQANRMLS